MLRGRVSTISSGRRTALQIPSSAAARIAGKMPFTRTPVRSQDAASTAAVSISQRSRTPLIAILRS